MPTVFRTLSVAVGNVGNTYLPDGICLPHYLLRRYRGTALARNANMKIKKQLKHYVGRKNTRRIYKAMPWVGGALALAAFNSTVGRRMLNDLTRTVESDSPRETISSAVLDRP